jgi:O-acetyl-ADP-ribose deacetylase (regulator of RNase III)
MNTYRIKKTLLNGRVEVVVGDITLLKADAIVNAANSSLLGGGGVDGAIHRAAGPELLAECRTIRAERYPRGLPTGRAVMTGAGLLPARFVIHTVGPVYRAGNPECARLLASCYAASLNLAREADCRSIAFPAVSTGVYGYPRDEAASVAWDEVKKHVRAGGNPEKIALVFFTDPDADVFLRAAGDG